MIFGRRVKEVCSGPPRHSTIAGMRPHTLLLALVIVACPKPAPEPAMPAPTALVCGLEEADHDEAVDHVVIALQLQASLDRWVTKYGRAAVGCVVEEVVADVHGSSNTVERAKAWLVAHP